ncbi:MAG: hypothetical protein KY462_04155 [Actinobacteria bacterium]|nr:hypothetical protein [Actinomycetota bacterium]
MLAAAAEHVAEAGLRSMRFLPGAFLANAIVGAVVVDDLAVLGVALLGMAVIGALATGYLAVQYNRGWKHHAEYADHAALREFLRGP